MEPARRRPDCDGACYRDIEDGFCAALTRARCDYERSVATPVQTSNRALTQSGVRPSTKLRALIEHLTSAFGNPPY